MYIRNITQTDVIMSPDFLSPRTFYPTDVMSPGILSPGTFCLPDVLSLRMFWPAGRFVPPDVLSLYVMSPVVVSPDVLSGHLHMIVQSRLAPFLM